jgi:DNA polymerase IV
MNAYFASCEQQDRLELRGRPTGVAPVLAETTCLIAASYEAKHCGIRTGTNVAEARLLCPNLQVVEARPSLYRDYHNRIVAAVNRIAPVHEVLSVDEMSIRPWGNESTVHEALKLGLSIQDEIRFNVGDWLFCSIGLAPNAFLAKVASDLSKPRGLSIIGHDDIPHKLLRLKLTDWPGIAGGMAARFTGAGVTTTEQMYGLDENAMREVFGGINGNRWFHLIRGHPVDLPATRRGQVGHSSVLEPKLRTPEGARSVAFRLLEKAGERLRSEGFHAGRLRVGVACYATPGWRREVKFQPCNSTVRFVQLLTGLWQDGVLKPHHVEVVLSDLTADRDVTRSLFDDGKAGKVDYAVDALNRKYGRGTVTTAAASTAVTALAHDRIPFGKPTDFR